AQNAIIGAAISAGTPRPVRSQCTEIGIDTDGHLVLKAKHTWLRIEFAPHLHKLQLRSGVHKPLHVRQFIPIPHTQYRLREAQWDDGTRAVIDARGLLHLRSSDTSIPETTIVLHTNDLAGWCAGVGAWGDRYFLPPGEYGLDVGWVWRDILQPFARLLR
ncbi:MAG TPA: hypothetical protein VHB77_04155, partial [Planctomycetaceae bacterium]|nr:hypothetical protein [Planctomycetaceae bacterium]